MTIREHIHRITQLLQPLYDAHEAAAIAKAYLQARLALPAHEMVLRANKALPAQVERQLDTDLPQLLDGHPLQYVLGEAEFYGLNFHVTPDVLIPRPETEELVDLIVQQYKHSPTLRIWDVGTGSGCIATTLAKNLPQADVYASDISEAALAVARENATSNHVVINFARHDMLDTANLPFGDLKFDILVSNPPYIPESVKKAMHPNVVEHEPHLALFVPEENPLVFYDALARIGKECLNPQGKIYAETFEGYHEELNELLSKNGYTQFQSIADINGKQRIIFVSLQPIIKRLSCNDYR